MPSDPTPTGHDLSLDQLIELERRAAAREQAPTDPTTPRTGETLDGEDGDVIVLPWWQRPFNIAVLVVTAAVLAGMIGWMIGDSGGRPDHNEVDIGFLQDMREHHEQAVLMAMIYDDLPDTDPEIRTVARTISRGQSFEAGRMAQMLVSFGADTARSDPATVMDWMADDEHGGHGDHALDPADYDDPFSAMPGMATTAELDALLAASGAAADELFVELMIAHHAAGVDMSAYAAERAANDQVVAFAEGLVKGQQAEIIELEKLVG